jgi:hypothetical protein
MLRETSPIFVYGFETPKYIENFHEFFENTPQGTLGRFVRGATRLHHTLTDHEAHSWVYGIEVGLTNPFISFVPPPAILYLAEQYGCSPRFLMAIDVDCKGQNEWKPEPRQRASISDSVAAHLVSLGCVRRIEGRTSVYVLPQPDIAGPWEEASNPPISYAATYPQLSCDVSEILKKELGDNFLYATVEERPSGSTEVKLTVKSALESPPAVNGVQPIWRPIAPDLDTVLDIDPRRPMYVAWKLWIADYLIWGQEMSQVGGGGTNIVAHRDGRVAIFPAPSEGSEGVRIGPHHIAQFSPDGTGFITDLRSLHQILVKLPIGNRDLSCCDADDISVGENGIYFEKLHLCLRKDGKYIYGPIPKGTRRAAEFYDTPGSARWNEDW